MAHSNYETLSTQPTHSLELKAFAAVVQRGEPIAMDLAAALMARGIDVEKYEARLEKLRGMN